MAVVILKWNPSISSYSTMNHIQRIIKCEKKMNWSVFEHEKVQKGDLCFLLKVGFGANGIVDAGTITKNPYNEEDWSSEGRSGVFYADYTSSIILNHDTCPILTSDELSKNIPDFDWYKGHSGVVLNDNQEKKFLELWNNYLEKNAKFLISKSEYLYEDSSHIFWNDKEKNIAKKKLIENLFDEYSINGKVSYCSVRLSNSNDRTLYYIDSTGNLKKGDYVKIPYGQRNSIKEGIIEKIEFCSKSKYPYPIESTKLIIEKIDNPSEELIERLRQLSGDEICTFEDFKQRFMELSDSCEYLWLKFCLNEKEISFDIRRYEKKLFIEYESSKSTKAELYNSFEDFETAKLFGKFKIKEIWNTLQRMNNEWE